MNNLYNNKHLSLEDRIKIEEGIVKGLRKFQIADSINKFPSTVVLVPSILLDLFASIFTCILIYKSTLGINNEYAFSSPICLLASANSLSNFVSFPPIIIYLTWNKSFVVIHFYALT